jgi:hypothetical protein
MAKYKKKPVQLVRITPGGKLSVVLMQQVKAPLFVMLTNKVSGKKSKNLDLHTVDVAMYMSLIEEMFMKHHTEFSLYRDGKILLTRAEALALWVLFQDAIEAPGNQLHPALGNLNMQLHQKLS